MSNMNDWATTGTDAITNSPVGSLLDSVDTIASYVPAMLLVFPEPLVPIPLPVPMPILFNPEKLRFDKSMTWKSTRGSKRNAPEADFGGGEPERFTLKLFLDSSFVPMGVQMYVFLLQQLMLKPPFGILDQPPLVKFVWGTTMSEVSYIQSMEYEYILFTPGGKPLQAEITLSLVEYNLGLLEMLQNPTSRSEARKTWVVTEGETLDWIAYKEYHDAAQWRHIANVNGLTNPMKLQPGQILKLTPLR